MSQEPRTKYFTTDGAVLKRGEISCLRSPTSKFQSQIPNRIPGIFLSSIFITPTVGHLGDTQRVNWAGLGGSQMFCLLPHSPCHLAPPVVIIQCQVERPPHSTTIRAWNESHKASSCPFLCSVFIAIAAEMIRCLFQVIISCLFTLAILCTSEAMAGKMRIQQGSWWHQSFWRQNWSQEIYSWWEMSSRYSSGYIQYIKHFLWKNLVFNYQDQKCQWTEDPKPASPLETLFSLDLLSLSSVKEKDDKQ